MQIESIRLKNYKIFRDIHIRDIPKLSYNIREAAAATGIGRSSIYGHILAGRLRKEKVGGRTLIPAESLAALVAGGAA